MAQSKYRDNPPTSRKYLNQSGMKTNACPEQPNGLAFDKPEIEQYFTQMQERHWDAEDAPFGEPRPWTPGAYELRERVEDSRFLNRPVTGNQFPKPDLDTDFDGED